MTTSERGNVFPQAKEQRSVSVKLIRKILACWPSIVLSLLAEYIYIYIYRKRRTSGQEKGQVKSLPSRAYRSLSLSFSFTLSLLRTRPIVPGGTEILNWKRPRAGATFIIPRSMIKIKSPAVSEAGNRCAGKSETRRKSEREPIACSVGGTKRESTEKKEKKGTSFPDSFSSLLHTASLMLSTNVSRVFCFFFFFFFRFFFFLFHERRSFEWLMRSSKIIDDFFRKRKNSFWIVLGEKIRFIKKRVSKLCFCAWKKRVRICYLFVCVRLFLKRVSFFRNCIESRGLVPNRYITFS